MNITAQSFSDANTDKGEGDRRFDGGARQQSKKSGLESGGWGEIRGNYLSNTPCLTQAFFKSGKSCSKSW